MRLKAYIRRLREPKEEPFAAHVEQEITDGLEKKSDDMDSIDIDMSEASLDFVESLLHDINVSFRILQYCMDGEGKLGKHAWKDDEREANGQPGCRDILESKLNIHSDGYGIYDVRNHKLPILQDGTRKTTGYSDMAVDLRGSLGHAVTASEDLVVFYVVAFVELITGKASLKQGQLLLQLVSLPRISNTGQGVVVLDTETVTK